MVSSASNVGSENGFIYNLAKNGQTTNSQTNDKNRYNILQIHK